MESLEDRSLLSVTPGSLDAPVSNSESGVLEAAAFTDAAIPVVLAESGGAADQTITVTAPNSVTTVTPLETPVVEVADTDGYNVKLSWSPIAYTRYYIVSYTTSSGEGKWFQTTDTSIGLDVSSSGEYCVPGEYVFEVQAFPDSGDIAHSPSKLGVTDPVYLPPPLETPIIEKVEIQGYSVTVKWDPNDVNADYFEVAYSNDGAQTWIPVCFACTGTEYTFDLEPVPGRYTYAFAVRSYSNNPNFSPSGYDASPMYEVPVKVQLKTPAPKIDSIVGYTVNLSWGSIGHADYYGIYCLTPGGGEADAIFVGTNYAEVTVTAGPGEYMFSVVAYSDHSDAYEQSLPGDAPAITLPKAAPLKAPIPKIDNALGYTVLLSWDPVGHADYYTVYYMKSGGDEIPLTSVETTDCVLNLATAGPGEYTFAVKAHSYDTTSYEDSSFGYTASVTLPYKIQLDAPELSTVVTTQGDQASVTVNWEPDVRAASYTLEYKSLSDGDWTVVPGLTDTYTIEGLDREMEYNIQVKAVAETGSTEYKDSEYTLIRVVTPASDWYLMDYNYTNFRVDSDGKYAHLYGVSQGGQEELLLATSLESLQQRITIYSDNTARNVTFTANALWSFRGDIVYVGGKTSNDVILLEGTDECDDFTMDQQTMMADVHTKDGKSTSQKVVFETVEVLLNDEYCGSVKMSGVRSITIDANEGRDTFEFVKFGTTYDLFGGESGGTALSFANATSAAKIDMGKTKAQSSVLSGQKGKICLHGGIEEVIGSKFNDKITTAASTRRVVGNGGSDTINLVGDADTWTSVYLNGYSQRVKGKGSGDFEVSISADKFLATNNALNGKHRISEIDGSKSTVNMSSVKSGSLDLSVFGDNVKVTGTKGGDSIQIYGDNANIQGNDGDDYIWVSGVNAKVKGGNGDDVIDLRNTEGKCTLDGGAGDNFLIGGRGDDVLKVSSGNNVLIGGYGADKLTGGRGQDCLVANITGENIYDDLINMWWDYPGDIEMIVRTLGTESWADGAKDTVKRGNGTNKFFYVNTSLRGSDFDVVDYKLDKGDILYDDLDMDIL